MQRLQQLAYSERYDAEEKETHAISSLDPLEEFFPAAKQDEEEQCGVGANGWDYVFFDWKGTLARRSGMSTEQRIAMRLHRFYEELKGLILGGNLAHRETCSLQTSSVPTFDEVQQAFNQAKNCVEQKRQKSNFSWAEVVDEILAQLHLSSIISDHDRHHLVLSFQVGGDHDSGTKAILQISF